MGLFDSGIINFIKLLLIIGLISMLYMIVMQKIKEQNHKISSLLSLVSTMASEITMLKSPEPTVVTYEKEDISNDSDSEVSYSDSEDSDNEIADKSENIEFFETQSIGEVEDVEICELHEDTELTNHEVCEVEVKSFDLLDQNDTIVETKNYKKMNVTSLLALAINKGLTTKEKGEKMKKKDLLSLF